MGFAAVGSLPFLERTVGLRAGLAFAAGIAGREDQEAIALRDQFPGKIVSRSLFHRETFPLDSRTLDMRLISKIKDATYVTRVTRLISEDYGWMGRVLVDTVFHRLV